MDGVGKEYTVLILSVSLNIGIYHLLIVIHIHLFPVVLGGLGSIRIQVIYIIRYLGVIK